MKKSRLIATFAVVTIALTAQVYATPTVTITAPTFTFTATSALEQSLATTLQSDFNSNLATSIKAMETQANTDISKYGSQTQLAKGFGNANAYSAQTSTLQGYQGYDLFAVAGGVMVGAQLPSFDPAVLTQIGTQIQSNPDLYAGAAISADFLNIGLHAGPIFGLFNKDLGNTMKNFYFNVKFGANDISNISSGSSSFSMKSTNFGLGVNYQFLQNVKILGGLFSWRGLSFGSGINYQSSNIGLTMPLDTITQTVTVTNAGVSQTATMTANPKITVGVNSTTVSIPLEATTSVQLLWLANINFGLGVDLVFGSTDVSAGATSDINVSDLKITGTTITGKQSKAGSLVLDASTKGVSPDLLRARIMSGFGLNLGPVKIDIPLYYYLASGFAFGITGAVVW